MRERLFRFKQFAVDHSKSAMKVGIDGILLGAWADVAGASEILDIGAGCGLISLMTAQRNQSAHITAVEIDEPSATECINNVNASAWRDRIITLCEDATDSSALFRYHRYDAIISNPPYFKSGVTELSNTRLAARHSGGLSPEKIIDLADSLLTPGGKLSMVIPTERLEDVSTHAESAGLRLIRILYVRDRIECPWKRALVQLLQTSLIVPPARSYLTLHEADGSATPDFKRLCGDFYLKM